MTTVLGDHTTSTKPLNNYTIELLRKYPDLRVLRRCNKDGSCTFCILCILSHNQDNQIIYRGIEYNTDSIHPKIPDSCYRPSAVYDTLTTNTYSWSLWWSKAACTLGDCHTIFTIEEALPVLEQEIMIGKL